MIHSAGNIIKSTIYVFFKLAHILKLFFYTDVELLRSKQEMLECLSLKPKIVEIKY